MTKEIPENAKICDKFMGCPQCDFQIDIGAICKPVCPNCGTSLSIYTIQEVDLAHD